MLRLQGPRWLTTSTNSENVHQDFADPNATGSVCDFSADDSRDAKIDDSMPRTRVIIDGFSQDHFDTYSLDQLCTAPDWDTVPGLISPDWDTVPGLISSSEPSESDSEEEPELSGGKMVNNSTSTSKFSAMYNSRKPKMSDRIAAETMADSDVPDLIHVSKDFVLTTTRTEVTADITALDKEIDTALVLALYKSPEGLCDKMIDIWSKVKSTVPHYLRRSYMQKIVHNAMNHLDEKVYADLHKDFRAAQRSSRGMTLFEFEDKLSTHRSNTVALPDC